MAEPLSADGKADTYPLLDGRSSPPRAPGAWKGPATGPFHGAHRARS